MKILMSCRQHPYHLCGGLAIASWNTARAAADAGHDVTYITGKHPTKEWSEENGIKVHWLKDMSPEADGYPFLYNYLRNEKNKLREQFDVFHSQSSALTPLLDNGIPVIFQDHGTQLAAMQDDFNQNSFGQKHTPFYNAKIPYYQMYHEFNKFIEGREIEYLRRFNAVLATSKISMLDLCTRYYLTNCHLFYHCIYDLPEPSVRDSSKQPVIGVFAYGLDSPQKSVTYGLKQLLPLKDEIIIKVVGKGTQVADFASKNFKNVIVKGYLPENEAIKELQEIDVLFECSCHHRGTNLTAITALGLGIPVLSYPTGGHMDLIGEDALNKTFGPGGAIVDPLPLWHHPATKPSDFNRINPDVCKVLMHLVENRKTFSKTALSHFKNRFSPQACSKSLDFIYKNVVVRN